MNAQLRIALIALASWLLVGCDEGPVPAGESDFAILALAAEDYQQASRGTELSFPRDHGPHPGYRIEWWYVTANLEDQSGQPYGAQWTLFRTATQAPGTIAPTNAWNSGQVFMAHFALTWPGGHRVFQRYARGGDHKGESRAGASGQPFAAWLDDWTLRSTGDGWLPLEVTARQDDMAMRLQMNAVGPLVLQGENGFSQKNPEGGGSHYYSQPFLQARGELVIGGKEVAVSGQAWLDREWSSQFLQPDQSGWDWFALHLESGEKLMLFRLRHRTRGPAGAYLHAVLIAPDGETRSVPSSDIRLQVVRTVNVAGRSLPLHWRVELPTLQRQLEIEALQPGQWMDVDFPYWEGAVTVSGEGPANRGRGYMELTGYPVTEK